MKKSLGFFLLLSALIFPENIFGMELGERINKKIVNNSGSGIYSDGDYKNRTNNFSAGQKIFVKVEFEGNGGKEKVLRLLNNGKSELKKIDMDFQEGNPSIFTAVLNAPSESGIYYLDIKIDDGQGAVYSSQQNINVGNVAGSSVSIMSDIKVVADSGKVVVTEKSEVTPKITSSAISINLSVSPTPGVEKEIHKKQTTLSLIITFLHNFFKNLTKLIR